MRMLFIAAILMFSITGAAQTLSAADAARHLGEHATVCGSIAGEHTASSSRGTPTFINLDRPYPNQVFTILIWGNERSQVGSVPHSGQMCVTGTITTYRGIPEIGLHEASDWFVPER